MRGCFLRVRGKRKSSFKRGILPLRPPSEDEKSVGPELECVGAETAPGYFRDLPFPLPQVFLPEGGKAHKGHDSCFLTSSCGDVFQMFPLTECGFATNRIPVSLRSSPPAPTAAF